MADIRTDPGSPEAVAYRLLEKVMSEEHGRVTVSDPRKHILDLYAECLRAATHRRGVS